MINKPEISSESLLRTVLIVGLKGRINPNVVLAHKETHTNLDQCTLQACGRKTDDSSK